MHSDRTYGHELINDEGKRTWNISDGMTYLYNGDQDQYGTGYWATVDPKRLAGTTTEYVTRPDGAGDRTRNIYSWVGGSSLGDYGTAGMHYKTLGNSGSTRNGTDAKKSWFLFDDEIVEMCIRDRLRDLVLIAESKKKKDYTEETYDAMREALSEAKAVLRDKTLTKADQPIVDMAYENLKEAVDALVLSGKTDPVTKVMTGIKITALPSKTEYKVGERFSSSGLIVAAVDVYKRQGGLFKTKGVGQRIMAAAAGVPVTVMETAGEGGAWGAAILASYMRYRKDGGSDSLAKYLADSVFADEEGVVMEPQEADERGFEVFMERYISGLPIERAAVECLPGRV